MDLALIALCEYRHEVRKVLRIVGQAIRRVVGGRRAHDIDQKFASIGIDRFHNWIDLIPGEDLLHRILDISPVDLLAYPIEASVLRQLQHTLAIGVVEVSHDPKEQVVGVKVRGCWHLGWLDWLNRRQNGHSCRRRTRRRRTRWWCTRWWCTRRRRTRRRCSDWCSCTTSCQE